MTDTDLARVVCDALNRELGFSQHCAGEVVIAALREVGALADSTGQGQPVAEVTSPGLLAHGLLSPPTVAWTAGRTADVGDKLYLGPPAPGREVPEDSVIIPRQTLNEWWCQLLATDQVAEAWTTDRCLKVADEMRVKFDANYLPALAPVWVIRPEGWQLVPKVMPDRMVAVMHTAKLDGWDLHGMWNALLAAAPQPQEQKG